MESHNKNIYAAYKASTARFDPDELRHWKYIKREKVNGKWKYWYDDSSNKLSTLQKKKSTLQTAYDKNFEKFYSNRKAEDLKSAKSETDPKYREWKVNNVNRWYSSSNTKKHTKNAYGMTSGEGYNERREIDAVSRSIDSHSKTVSGTVDRFMQKNGAKAANVLNKISNAVDNAKSKLGVDKVKDKLGYDEFEDYETAKSDVDAAKRDIQKAEYLIAKNKKAYDAAVAEYDEYQKELSDARYEKRKLDLMYMRSGTATNDTRDRISKERASINKKIEDLEKKDEELWAKLKDAEIEYSGSRIDLIIKRNSSAPVSELMKREKQAKAAYEKTAHYKVSNAKEKVSNTVDKGKEASANVLERLAKRLRN